MDHIDSVSVGSEKNVPVFRRRDGQALDIEDAVLFSITLRHPVALNNGDAAVVGSQYGPVFPL